MDRSSTSTGMRLYCLQFSQWGATRIYARMTLCLSQADAHGHRPFQESQISAITYRLRCPPLTPCSPLSLFPESGNLLIQLSRLSKFLSRTQHVRIVDKGAGVMWGFCVAWLWDQVEDFMRKEKFTPAGCTVDQWNTKIARVVNDMSVHCNPKGRLCILYVLAKAKSLRTGKWVFRGMSASPAPVLNGRQLRLAARSFTCMLRLLQKEITHNFQCADIKQVAGWFRFISQKGALSLTEMDCKKQFDTINPRAILRSFKEASSWIYKKRRWRQVNLQWSVSKESAKLDRAGQATNTRFWCITHDLLSRLLKFELTENNMLQAVGTLWKMEGSIPMGGPFSAQSADLHTLWKIKRAGKKLRAWGELNISTRNTFTGSVDPCGSTSAGFMTIFCLPRTTGQGPTPVSSRDSLKPSPVFGTLKSYAHAPMGEMIAAWVTA